MQYKTSAAASEKSFGKQAVICKVTRITRMFPILKWTDVLYSPTYQHKQFEKIPAKNDRLNEKEPYTVNGSCRFNWTKLSIRMLPNATAVWESNTHIEYEVDERYDSSYGKFRIANY